MVGVFMVTSSSPPPRARARPIGGNSAYVPTPQLTSVFSYLHLRSA
jgi:hypothetical protein